MKVTVLITKNYPGLKLVKGRETDIPDDLAADLIPRGIVKASPKKRSPAKAEQ
jgi:hypothetical protein